MALTVQLWPLSWISKNNAVLWRISWKLEKFGAELSTPPAFGVFAQDHALQWHVKEDIYQKEKLIQAEVESAP